MTETIRVKMPKAELTSPDKDLVQVKKEPVKPRKLFIRMIILMAGVSV